MVVEYIIKTESGSFYEIEEHSPKDWFIHFKGAIYPILAFGQAPADVLEQKENKALFLNAMK